MKKPAADIGKENDVEGAEAKREEEDDEDVKREVLTDRPHPPNTTTTKKPAVDISKEDSVEEAKVKKEEKNDEDVKREVLTDRPNPPNTTTTTYNNNNNSSSSSTGVHNSVVQGQEKPVSHLDIVLGDENGGTIPIYDSCDEIRAKILAFLDS